MDEQPTYRLPESQLYGFWMVLDGMVNMNDLCSAGPGGIVRVRSMDAIRYMPMPLEPYDHVAGMISDAA